jgi:hypothetical protein
MFEPSGELTERSEKEIGKMLARWEGGTTE